MWEKKKKKHLKEPNSKMRNSNTIKGKKKGNNITKKADRLPCLSFST